MKQKNLYLYSLLAVIIISITACKKDRLPSLIITVTTQDGTIVSDATVHVYPDITDSVRVVNTAEMDQTGTTFTDGTVRFEFKHSAVLDIEVEYVQDIGDTLRGRDVVKVEVLRQRKKANDVAETVEIF